MTPVPTSNQLIQSLRHTFCTKECLLDNMNRGCRGCLVAYAIKEVRWVASKRVATKIEREGETLQGDIGGCDGD